MKNESRPLSRLLFGIIGCIIFSLPDIFPPKNAMSDDEVDDFIHQVRKEQADTHKKNPVNNKG